MESQATSTEARLHFLDYWRVIRSRWMFVTLIFLMVVIVTVVVTSFLPKQYLAAARIMIEQEKPTVTFIDRENVPSYDPYFLQTQYEIIQSHKVLYPAIERLELTRIWAHQGQPLTLDSAFQRLKRSLGVRRYRDTTLIEITVLATDPALAARIANTIAAVYESERMEVKKAQTQQGIDKLREELAAQLERLGQAQAEVERLRKDLQVPVFANNTKLSDITVTEVERQLTAHRIDAARNEVRLKELEKLTPTQLRHAIASVIQDATVQQLLKDLTVAELRFEVLKQDYGPENPEVLSAQSIIEKLDQQLTERLAGVMAGFRVECEVSNASVVKLEEQLQQTKNLIFELESGKYLPFRNAEREVESETRLYEALKERLRVESVNLDLPRSPVELIDPAATPRVPHSPVMMKNLLLGGVVGVALGLTLAFFIEFLDTSVKRVDDVERYLDLPVLGVIPQQAGLVARGQARASDIEAYRMLRSNIEFARGPSPIVSLCVASAAAGEGKSFTIANLACICAQHGARVLVVDSDLRRPAQHQLFNVPADCGLAEYLIGEKSTSDILLATSVPNVFLIPAGSGSNARHALPMLSSPRMGELIRTVAQQFDVVLYDTPPVLGVSEATSLAREIGATLLVIQHRRYPRQMANRARQILEQSGTKLLGVVVNNVAPSDTDSHFYHHHQNDEYLNAPEARAQASRPAATAPTGRPRSPDDEIELTGKY